MFNLAIVTTLICLRSKCIAADSPSMTDPASEYYYRLSGKAALFQHTDKVKFTEEGVLLNFGYCMTQGDNQSLFMAKCPFFEVKGHNVSNLEAGYVLLPDNISELNDYMCGPMNRKGLLCKDCIDGFGPSVTSLGYKCSNCTDVWYGISLYLAVELIPITLFYLIILIFKIQLSSAPIVLYLFYSQMMMFEILFERDEPVEKFVSENGGSPLLNCVLFFYGIWNLDFIRYILPPFCVSPKLQLIHIQLLSYISVVYPLFLIFLTWVCVELHGRNFKPFVLLWRPFHKCFVRLQRGWNTKSDIIDVFASFFLLTYNKLMFQLVLFAQCLHVRYVKNMNTTDLYKLVMSFDMDANCLGTKHLSFLIPSVTFFLLFNLLPALLLVLYPVKRFRRCLSKCKLDSLFLTTFVEKFHGCYRDGLDGGRDMRSFSGLYFFLVCLVILNNAIVYRNLKLYTFIYTSLIFVASALLIAFIKPYKRTYMNVLDTLLLAHLTVICILLSREYFIGDGIEAFAVILVPAIVFKLLLIFRVVKMLYTSKLVKWCEDCFKSGFSNKLIITVEDSEIADNSRERQPLIDPTSTVVGMI